jgi:hypothetical protein
MTSLDQFWASAIADALEKAELAGRADIADYLKLRASNDLLRASSVKWLMRGFTEAGDDLLMQGKRLTLNTSAENQFSLGNATMRGSRLEFSHGLRHLSVEAGWPRLPQDGFMRGGALAAARVSHRGKKKDNALLALVRLEEGPAWYVEESSTLRLPLPADFFQSHLEILLGG